MCPASCFLFYSQLMDKECYKDIEKIKTIGSTYMAAVGLVPTAGSKVSGGSFRVLRPVRDSITFIFTFNHLRKLTFRAEKLLSDHLLRVFTLILQVKKSISTHLSTIADFAIEMFDVLDEINYQSYNDFILRVGKLQHTADSSESSQGRNPEPAFTGCFLHRY